MITTTMEDNVVIEKNTVVVKNTTDVVFNENTENFIPTTFVDDVEFIWRELENMTQEKLAEILGWSREKIRNYNALQNVCLKAWVIIGTEIEKTVPFNNNNVVPFFGTNVPFNENLLRNIISLYDWQQLELVQDLT